MNIRVKNIVGDKFGKLTITNFVKTENRLSYWECLCECGVSIIKHRKQLHVGSHCGCNKNNRPKGDKNAGYGKFKIINDLTSRKINMLSVIGFGYDKRLKCGKNRKYWKCECECGNECFVDSQSLVRGLTKSCGCLYRQRFRGGKIDCNGYRMVYSPKVKKYIQEHRYVYENHYDVKLHRYHNIHHINGDRLDNRIEN
jgi:hypothetical protein